MSEPQYCYRCQEIVTFCECEQSITSEGDWQRWAEHELEAKDKRIAELEADRAYYQRWGDTNER